MSATLYLLRRQPDRLSPSLFRMSDAETDIVLIEQTASIASSGIEGPMVPDEGVASDGSHLALTYADLVEKVFSSEHVIVL